MNSMRQHLPKLLINAGLFSAILAAATACNTPHSPTDGVLRDMFTRQPIGHVDADTGAYCFDDGAVIQRHHLEPVDQDQASTLINQIQTQRTYQPPTLDGRAVGSVFNDPIPSGGGSACTSSCWYMVETTACGQVGCKGCCTDVGGGYCSCWEYCWDHCSEGTGGSSRPPSPL